MLGLISNIQRFSLHDGPGIRSTVFFQGCPLRCWWCHNPECMPIYSEETGATKYSPASLLEEIRKDEIFYSESNGGVTFSGGEPMLQALFLKNILQQCRSKKIHTAIDTSGHVASCVMQEVAECADLILFDLKLIDSDLHTRYTGMSNEKILKNLKMLDQNNINLRIRIPLIPGITDTHSNIMAIIEFLRKLKHPHSVDLIDYHAMAENKYQKLGMDFKMKQMKGGKADPRAILELFTEKDIKAYSAS